LAEKKATHTVTHDSLYLRVNGKMTHVKKGSDISLSGNIGKGLEDKKMVQKKTGKKFVDLNSEDK